MHSVVNDSKFDRIIMRADIHTADMGDPVVLNT
jgi:hypothetical protein